jgi:mxaA protein
MKQIFIWWLAASFSGLVIAETQPAVQVVSMHNPSLYAGVQIGDVLQRSVQLSVKANEQLSENNLPLKGLQRNGVELKSVQAESQTQGDKKIYTLTFDYQVFVSSGKPVQLQLPAEKITFNSGAAFELPAWRFWLMAQLPDRLREAKPTVIPQYKPALLDIQTPKRILVVSLFFAVIGSLMLFYRNASWTWLPMMNGHFAHAYRKLKKLPVNAESQKQATLIVQHALNQRFGQQMLSHHVTEFIAQQPAFKPLEQEIHTFFAQANALLYAGQSAHAAEYLQQCKALTRQLRDCERGM